MSHTIGMSFGMQYVKVRFFFSINAFHSNTLSNHISFTGALKTKGFQSLLDYPDDFRFDLIVNDFTLGGCLLGFVHKFNNPPLISVTPFNHPTYLKNFIGGHHYYSYIPHVFLHYNGDMNIFQRMYNFIVHLIESL